MTRGGTVPEKLKVLERGPKNIVGLQQTWGFMWNYIYIYVDLDGFMIWNYLVYNIYICIIMHNILYIINIY